jgi:hypothetical protein
MSSSPIVDRLLDTGVSDALTDLALDLRWSFNHSADQHWEQLDPELWELTHNPWLLLQTVSAKNCKLLPPTQTFWQPAKDAARKIAFAEDGAIFEGYSDAGIVGIRQGTSNPPMTLPDDVREYPNAVAQGLSQLRLVGVNGPYAVLLGANAYTALAETSDNGYPVLEHVKRLVDDKIIWAPAIEGAFVVTTRGGDFDLHIGQDVSIGYLSHTDATVTLYLQDTFTFLLLTAEAAIALAPPVKPQQS